MSKCGRGKMSGWFTSFVALVTIVVGASPSAAQRAVLKTPLTIYQQPATSAPVVTNVAAGDTISVVGRDGAWVQVKTQEGRYGWFSLGTNHRKTEKPPPTVARDEGPKVQRDSTPSSQPAPAATASSKAATEPSSREESFSGPGSVSAPHFTYFTFDMGTFEGDFAYLLRLTHHRSSLFSFEGSFGHVLDLDGSMFLLHAGVVFHPLSPWPVEPYLAAGYGLHNTVPKQTVTSKSITHGAANYGLGLRIPLGERVAIKSEFRQYSVFMNGSNVNRHALTIGIVLGRVK